MSVQVTVQPVNASGPGALSGYAVQCSTCGESGRYSLESLAWDQSDKHERFHARKGAK